MKTIEYRHREADRERWGPGPWDNEPDKRQWLDEESGLACLIVRSPLGAWCGYVGVPENHPYFGKEFSDVTRDIEVHGDLTFSSFCAPDDKEHGICHIVEPGENDRVWWLGFDCAHAFDLVPSMDALNREIPELREINDRYGEIANKTWGGRWQDIYRDEHFVTKETVSLASQLATTSGAV